MNKFRLIKLANRLAIENRQGVLPPAVNQAFPPESNFHSNNIVEDPFLLTANGQENYPNSIQDVLSQVHKTPEILTQYIDNSGYKPSSTTKAPKKKIIYKVVTKSPPKTEHGTTKRVVYKLATTKPPATKKPPSTTYHEVTTAKPQIMYHTAKPETVEDHRIYDHTRKPITVPIKDEPKKQNPKNQQKPDNYLAVIPYKDVAKLFEMLNKHTKPTNEGYKPKKKPKTTQKPHLPPPTTKRTEKLQPKVIKRTPLGRKKKKKKTVHVSKTLKQCCQF